MYREFPHLDRRHSSPPRPRHTHWQRGRCCYPSSGMERERKEHPMNAVDILKYGQLTVLKTLEGFPESEWETPGACGVWSVKDIIAHLASYEHVLEDVLTPFVGSGTNASGPYLTTFTEPGGQFNDTEVNMRKEKSMQEVLDAFKH